MSNKIVQLNVLVPENEAEPTKRALAALLPLLRLRRGGQYVLGHSVAITEAGGDVGSYVPDPSQPTTLDKLRHVLQQTTDDGTLDRLAIICHPDVINLFCDMVVVLHGEEILGSTENQAEWSGSPDPNDPDNQWIDDDTGEIKKATS
jgi:hypothetical protein